MLTCFCCINAEFLKQFVILNYLITSNKILFNIFSWINRNKSYTKVHLKADHLLNFSRFADDLKKNGQKFRLLSDFFRFFAENLITGDTEGISTDVTDHSTIPPQGANSTVTTTKEVIPIGHIALSFSHSTTERTNLTLTCTRDHRHYPRPREF